ncbi:MAG: hypothetical protein PHS73_04770 [Candidatus Peribacteraceae bacterium]|nr:hypothetical protein [Candidatus Peribacteraceae bacterium]
MTLAARERFGESFFTASPQAYFMDNLQEQAKGKRTIPDWWRTLRSEEERRRRKTEGFATAKQDRSEKEFKKYLETEARDAFARVMDRVFQDFKEAGKPDDVARENAQSLTEMHFRNRFFQEHPECHGDGPSRAGDLLS